MNTPTFTSPTSVLASLGIQIDPSLPSPSSIAEEIDISNELAMDEAKEARILDHISQCGSYFYRPSAANGRKLIAYEVACGYWRRGCERCLQARAEEFRVRFRRCIKEVDGKEFLGIAQLDKRLCAKTIKRMKKLGVRYWRIPTEKGIILIFDSLHFPELNNPELYGTVSNDWVALCQTPKNSRYSGNLGKLEEEEKVGIVVKVPQFKLGMADDGVLDKRVINSAWSLALKNTDGLDPKYDIDEIEESLQIRMDAFEEAIESMGGVVVEKYRIMTRVEEKDFGWSKVISTLDTKCTTESPPGFVEDKFFTHERLKDELWPI